MLRFVILYVFLGAAWAQSTDVNNCAFNDGALPINTYVEGCNTPPCSLPQLQDVAVDFKFRVPRATQTMRTLATAYIPGPLGIILPIPYDLGVYSYTCNFLNNSTCPVSEGEVVNYSLSLNGFQLIPQGLTADVEFRVVDEDQTPILCVNVPITVV